MVTLEIFEVLIPRWDQRRTFSVNFVNLEAKMLLVNQWESEVLKEPPMSWNTVVVTVESKIVEKLL